MTKIDLKQYGLHVEDVQRNISPAQLYQEAIRNEKGTALADSGALIAYSGSKTGRSPKDKRVVRNDDNANDIWWGNINIPIEDSIFRINRERAIDYLNTRDRLYIVDAFAGWDPKYRMKVRVICTRPYHALFMHTMLIRPTREELASFGEPDTVIFNAGQFPANRHTSGMTSKTSVDVNLSTREMVILGTEYAGEMKKGVFTLMNYFMPKQDVLSMHCSATADRDTGRSSIMFGLSRHAKTDGATLEDAPSALDFIGVHLRVDDRDEAQASTEGGAPTRGSSLFLLVEPIDPSAPTLFATPSTHVNAVAPRHGNDPISVPLLEPVIRSFGDLVRKHDAPDRPLAELWTSLRDPLRRWSESLPPGFSFVRAFGD